MPDKKVRTRFAPVSHGLHARGQPAHRPVCLPDGQARRWHLHPPHRGHRPGAAMWKARWTSFTIPCGRPACCGTRARTSAAPWAPMCRASGWACSRSMPSSWWQSGKAYYCFCAKERLEDLRAPQQRADGEMAHYDGHCRDLPAEEVQSKLDAGVPLRHPPEDAPAPASPALTMWSTATSR